MAKMSKELQDCKKMLEKLMSDGDCAPFLEPVNWKELGLTDYPKIIKRPMDLGTVLSKLNSGKYSTIFDFQKDIKLIWKNCKTYNADGSDFFLLAEKLDKRCDKDVSKILKKYNIKSASKPSALKLPSVEEKANFCKMLYEISEVDLGKIVKIIDEKCEDALDKKNPDEVEVNIDLLDIESFKIIEAVLRGFAQDKSEAPPAKKAKV